MMKTIIRAGLVSAVASLLSLTPAVAGELSWRVDDSTVYRITDDGAWYCSMDNGQHWVKIIQLEVPQAVRVNEAASESAGTTVAPNPVRDRVRITVPEDLGTLVQMVLVNTAGEAVDVTTQVQQDGKHTVVLDCSAYGRGSYTVQLKGSLRTATSTIVLQ